MRINVSFHCAYFPLKLDAYLGRPIISSHYISFPYTSSHLFRPTLFSFCSLRTGRSVRGRNEYSPYLDQKLFPDLNFSKLMSYRNKEPWRNDYGF